jgi:TonB-linked SusC/RagA family outer membrane protein
MAKRFPVLRKIIFGWLLSHVVTLGLGQNQPLTLASVRSLQSMQDTQIHSLLDLLKILEKKYGVVFDYNRKTLKSKTVTISRNELQDTSLDHLLMQLLSPLELKYEKYNEHSYIIYEKRETLKSNSSRSSAQPEGMDRDTSGASLQETGSAETEAGTMAYEEIVVSGKVTSSDNSQGLPGVSILVKGTTIGTASDGEGNYKIRVPDEKAVLVFSFIGYVAEEVAVNGRSVINMALVPDIKSLSEVVVVGYGTQKKTDVTGSVATLSAEKIKDLPVQSVDQAMVGQMAGVQVSQTSGAPGGGMQVRIRGTGSISAGNEPLYVIDGFPVQGSFNQNYNPLTTINPSDIESINVLKDASSTAIYGSRGSNGVVIITTKRGRAGKPKVDLDIYTGMQQIERYTKMMNAQEFAEASIESRNIFYTQIIGGNINDTNEERMKKTPNAYAQIPTLFSTSPYDTDWQKAYYRTAPMRNYQLTVSGGTDKLTYAIGGGYFKQEGIIPNSDLVRYSVRTNLEARVNEKIKVGINLAPTFKTSKIVDLEGHPCCGGTVLAALTYLPQLPVRYDDGRYSTMTNMGEGFLILENPLVNALEENRNQMDTRLLGTIYGDYSIFKDLTLRISVGADINNSREDRFRSSRIGNPGQPAPTIPSGFSNANTYYNWLNENTLTYTKTLGDHSLNVLTGFTAQKAKFFNTNVTAINFPNDLVTTLNGGQINGGFTSAEEWALLSGLGRINYSFREKYLLTATIRADGSSRFGSNNRWGYFPSVALGWRLSEEEFLKNIQQINELKIRGSYGQNGNNFIGNYDAIGRLGSSNYILGAGAGSLISGVVPISIANSDLTWEKANQTDIGLDVSLYNNRIAFSAEYYNRITSGLLLNVQVPSISGFTNALKNIGRVRNHGYEFSLNTINIDRKFTWSTNFNISFNRNVVQALGPKGDPIRSSTDVADTHITQIGQPLGSFFGYKVDGVFRDQSAVDAGPKFDAPVVTRPGDFRFQDINDDGKITPADRTVIGNPFPDFTYGFTNTFSFKGFDLNILLQGSYGNEVLFLQNVFLDL